VSFGAAESLTVVYGLVWSGAVWEGHRCPTPTRSRSAGGASVSGRE